jgi:phosphoglycolate phosphatase-like HAD superfamily hydrolase
MIFDLDGTLGDTLPVCFAAFRATFQQLQGRLLDDAAVHALFGPSEEGIFRQQTPDDWRGAMDIYLREYERAHAQCPRLFPGMERVLAALRRRGVRLAVVTGKGPRSAAISARVFQLYRFFDAIEAADTDRPVKTRAIHHVLARWALDAQHVAYIGDAASDVDTAKQTGLLPVAAAWAPTADPECLQARDPAVLFRSVEAFVSWAETTCGPATGTAPREG